MSGRPGIRKYSLAVTPADQGKRLDQFLAEKLPEALARPVSKGKVRKLIVAGAVYLNGKRVRIASKTVLQRARVEAFIDPKRLFEDEGAAGTLGGPGGGPFELGPERVLFEDEFIIVVDKPAGIPTQPTIDEARDNLFAAVKKFIAKRDGIPQPYLGLHHRLDRDTSGVVLFTKKVEANAGIAEIFSKHLAQKVYNAITERGPEVPPAAWTIENHLGIGGKVGKKTRYASVRSGGDYALTEFRLLETFSQGYLVEAKPKTGRTHQIRVHLAEDDLPILGDTFYGARKGGAPRVMLHAASLTFPHPISRTEMKVESPLPEDFQACQKSLQALRQKL